MKFQFTYEESNHSKLSTIELSIFSAFQNKIEKVSHLINSHWGAELKKSFAHSVSSKNFKADDGEMFFFQFDNGTTGLVVGLGEKKSFNKESLRKKMANVFKAISNKFEEVQIHLDHFQVNDDKILSATIIMESIGMTNYQFDRHLTTKKTIKLKSITIATHDKKSSSKKFELALSQTNSLVESISLSKDLVNEAPNILNSVAYSKFIQADAKKLKNVKIKVLGKTELKKENMNMFLAVNAGSAHEAQLVHLSYTPKKVSSKTKHIALVGKGLTFDTGGYSLKPGSAMMNMKFDMAGSSTVYAAFRTAVLLELPIKISCYLGMTDNAVNELAVTPDSIVKARNGKTVEILNTDAEGRLVLGDVLHYACDSKPDAIIDAATLTGAILVALGSEVCGLFSNDQKLADALLNSAKNSDEYMWQLPIIQEHKNDIKSNVADLKNMGGHLNWRFCKSGCIFTKLYRRKNSLGPFRHCRNWRFTISFTLLFSERCFRSCY